MIKDFREMARRTRGLSHIPLGDSYAHGFAQIGCACPNTRPNAPMTMARGRSTPVASNSACKLGI